MKPIYMHLSGAIALTVLIAACVPAPRPAPPAPAPSPQASAPPPPAPATVYDDWMDAPQTPGDWSYRAAAEGGTASYRAPGGSGDVFTMRCERPRGRIVLTRFGLTGNPGRAITIRSETATRALPAENAGGAVQATLGANDRLLDAMALSKGRFAVEVPGSATLYLPSWAEVTRVIEDCR